MNPKLKHDFINNCLRLEILQKLMLDDLEAQTQLTRPQLKEEHLDDYVKFLDEQKSMVSQILKEKNQE